MDLIAVSFVAWCWFWWPDSVWRSILPLLRLVFTGLPQSASAVLQWYYAEFSAITLGQLHRLYAAPLKTNVCVDCWPYRQREF
jgi:hypothetical protein